MTAICRICGRKRFLRAARAREHSTTDFFELWQRLAKSHGESDFWLLRFQNAGPSQENNQVRPMVAFTTSRSSRSPRSPILPAGYPDENVSVATPAEPRGEKKISFVQILGGEKLLKFVEECR